LTSWRRRANVAGLVTLAAFILAALGLTLALLPLAIAVPLGFGPFVSLCGGGVAVAGLLLAIVALLRARAAGRPRPGPGLALALAGLSVVCSLVVERRLIAREQAADAAAEKRDPRTAEQRRADEQQFDEQFKENLNK
jgi:hypothetical protein